MENEDQCSLVDHTGKTHSRLFLYTMCMTWEHQLALSG